MALTEKELLEQANIGGVVAYQGAFNLQDDHLLGHLEFHSIPDMRVPKDEMGQIWTNNNLDPKYLPAKIHPADAFRRATSTASSGNIEVQLVDANGNLVKGKARLLVREVINDQNFITRHLVRELVDDKNDVLEYDHVASWRFHKKNKLVEDACASKYASEYPYDVLVKDTTKLVDELLNYHTRDTIRTLIVKVLKDLNPTSIMPRSQGKFIPKNHHDTLHGIQGLLSDLKTGYAGGQDCVMDLIPIVNTLEQRDMITRKAGLALKEEADELIIHFAQTMKGKQEIKEDVAKRLIEKALEMRNRVQEYEGLLNVRMNVLHQQMQDFVNNVRLIPVEQKEPRK